jgi:hypothetical protein
MRAPTIEISKFGTMSSGTYTLWDNDAYTHSSIWWCSLAHDKLAKNLKDCFKMQVQIGAASLASSAPVTNPPLVSTSQRVILTSKSVSIPLNYLDVFQKFVLVHRVLEEPRSNHDCRIWFSLDKEEKKVCLNFIKETHAQPVVFRNGRHSVTLKNRVQSKRLRRVYK